MYKHILYLVDKTHIHITMVEEDIPVYNNGNYYFYKLYGTNSVYRISEEKGSAPAG